MPNSSCKIDNRVKNTEITERLRNFIAQQHLLAEGEVVSVALSGGADSVALLCLLRTLGYPLVALHCNFHLRGEESDRDEQFVRSLCERLNVPFHVQHFSTTEHAKEHHQSIEMAARQLRYDWFAQMRHQLNIRLTAVAHHRDDQAETILLNLLRGTGLRGLCGMHPLQGEIVRPLLTLTRNDILSYLQSIGQSYVTDSTNLQQEARRNQLRLDLLPRLRELNPRVDEALCGLGDVVRQSMPLYEQGVQTLFREEGVGESFPLSLLRHPSAQTLLHEWLSGKGFRGEQLQEILASEAVGAVWQSPTHRLLRDRETLLLEAQDVGLETPIIHYEEVKQMDAFSPDCIYCDADLLTLPLTLRHPQAADRLVPFGKKRLKLVSDVLGDHKLNRFQRERQWLLLSGEDIVWVVGLRADNRFRITEKTKRILKITISSSQTLKK